MYVEEKLHNPNVNALSKTKLALLMCVSMFHYTLVVRIVLIAIVAIKTFIVVPLITSSA